LVLASAVMVSALGFALGRRRMLRFSHRRSMGHRPGPWTRSFSRARLCSASDGASSATALVRPWSP
jgi:hypothetical protein